MTYDESPADLALDDGFDNFFDSIFGGNKAPATSQKTASYTSYEEPEEIPEPQSSGFTQSCKPLKCGSRGCDDSKVCKNIGSMNFCLKVYQSFCDDECKDGKVRDPTRYCKCISEDRYDEYFCEEEESCDCSSASYSPVTCTDGVEYNNKCEADCAGASGCTSKSSRRARSSTPTRSSTYSRSSTSKRSSPSSLFSFFDDWSW